MTKREVLSSSFRDPSGRMVRRGGVLYREVSHSYAADFDLLMDSGLYAELTEAGLLVRHGEELETGEWYKVLRPEQVPFISYPYEWSFEQLHAAALATLDIQQRAMRRGMSLKDASAYNIQFLRGLPVLIDTLSFEAYTEEHPWVAYRQFCQHFLAPLALMAKADLRLGLLAREFIDGIPLDLASKLLPWGTKASFGLAAHLHLHAGSQRQHAQAPGSGRTLRMSQSQLAALLDSLTATVRSLRPPSQKTEWGDYYENTNYAPEAQEHKRQLVGEWIEAAAPGSLWDAGANDGTFASLASSRGIPTIASDIDPVAVGRAYARHDANLLPLVIDLTNPSPAVGWRNHERDSFLDRLKVDLSLCLALIHHLAIANNLPLEKCAELFAAAGPGLIIEFVPKEDSNAAKLLAARENIFPDYSEAGFEKAFSQFFAIVEKKAVAGSLRTLYRMERL